MTLWFPLFPGALSGLGVQTPRELGRTVETSGLLGSYTNPSCIRIRIRYDPEGESHEDGE